MAHPVLSRVVGLIGRFTMGAENKDIVLGVNISEQSKQQLNTCCP